MTVNNNISTLVILIQRKQGQSSDVMFAKTLGVPRTVWVQAKHGNRQPGLTLLRAILRTYPELTEDVITYLRDGDGKIEAN